MKLTSNFNVVMLSVVAILLFGVPVMAQAAPQKETWKEYAYPENGFAVTLPSDPHPHESTQMPNGTAYSVTLMGGSRLSIHTMAAADDCIQVLDTQAARARDSGKGRVNGFKVVSIKEVAGEGYKGFEFVQQVPSGEMNYERWVCGSQRLFVFGSVWKPEGKQPEEISRIVNSFRILPKK